MKKYNVLIVMPIIRPGGVGSSLASFYPLFDKNCFDVEVFPLVYSSEKEKKILSYYSAILKCDETVSAFYCNMKDVSLARRIYSVLVKAISVLIGRQKLKELIIKKSVRKIEQIKTYDTIIGFQEGITTEFASYFHCTNSIAMIHCNYNYYLPMNQSEENLYCRFNHIITVSKYTTDVFKQRYPKLVFKTYTIYNPLDIDRVTKLSLENIDDSRFKKDSFTIISVGRIVEVKRFTSIPLIADVLKKNNVSFTWYIIGNPFDEKELHLIHELLDRYDLHRSVIYLGGKLNPYPYFKNADLLVSTSKSEACPMIFNEAKILNVPIVSTDFPSAYEFIESGVNGFITPIENMAETICMIAKDPTLYNNLKAKSVYSNELNTLQIKRLELLMRSIENDEHKDY